MKIECMVRAPYRNRGTKIVEMVKGKESLVENKLILAQPVQVHSFAKQI